MKKILLGTTAVVALATMSTEAFAADKIALSLGGFMNQYVGLSNNDETSPEPTMKLGQRSNSEVYFRGSTTLDNGLSVGVDIQREADRGNQGNDISALTVSSDAMGAVTLGGTTHAADDFAVGAPLVGPLDFMDAAGDGWANTANTAFNATYGVRDLQGGQGNKNLKMKYVSPSFNGVSIGASYDAANGTNGQKAGTARAATSDASTVGLMFDGEMSGAAVSADVSRVHNNGGTAADYTQDHIGVSVGMSGFTVGGSYSNFSNNTALNDGDAWELGVAYETGPYSIGAGYMSSTKEAGVANTADSKDKEILIGLGYDLGASVGLVAQYYNTKATAAGATNSKASGVVAGIEVGF